MRETMSPHLRTPVGGSGARSVGSALLDAVARHASERPEAQAVGEVDGAKRACTYGELAELVRERARVLSERVTPGEVVIAVLPAGVDVVAWLCAAIAADVRLMLMHPQIAGPEALAAAARARAVAAVVAPGMAVGAALEHLSLHRRERVARSRNGQASSGGGGGVVLGSSGTVGLPKLALRESASLDADAANVIGGMGLVANDRVVFATPLSHSYGVDVMVGALTAGATLRVLSQFDAEALTRELSGGRGQAVLPGVPFIFEALARHTPLLKGGVRLALSAGSPLPERVRREFFSAWGVEVGQLYGATELGTVTMDVPGCEGFDPASVGRPLPGVSVRVVDIDDPRRTVGVGEEGQLAVRAASMLSGYLDGDVPMVDGHLLTGDLARIGPDGRVRITGRLKLLIDVGAYKVNPLEVEAVLATHPVVKECVVVPVAASETVQRLRAVVVARDGVAPPASEELRRFLRERLSPIKVPRVVEIVASLPKTPTGKVIRDRA